MYKVAAYLTFGESACDDGTVNRLNEKMLASAIASTRIDNLSASLVARLVKSCPMSREINNRNQSRLLDFQTTF